MSDLTTDKLIESAHEYMEEHPGSTFERIIHRQLKCKDYEAVYNTLKMAWSWEREYDNA